MIVRREMRIVIVLSVLLIASRGALHAQDSTGMPRCANAADESARLWCDGSALFIQHTPDAYSRSIGPYSRALALEKKKQSLSRNAWLIMIDNLGMAYGITGEFPKAKETFEYGLSKEPTYPIFYYNMACVYAGLNDEAKTIDYLKRAFALRSNVIPSESMPDPRTDDSFQEYMHDPHFVSALRAMGAR